MRFVSTVVLIMTMCAPAAANPAAREVLNALRAEAGRAAIRYSPRLERAAQGHANDMATRDFFSHRGSDGSKFGDRIRAAGYRFCFAAENIANGQDSLEVAMQAWANSPGHYRNMVNRKARQFGIARSEGGIWVMLLAKRC